MVDPLFEIRTAERKDVSLVLSFIKELAEYEKLSHEVLATEKLLTENLFGEKRIAEVILGYYQKEPAAFAMYFYNFSTFLGKTGIYLEDLFVKPMYRGRGFGKIILSHLAGIAKEKNCGRLEWSVLDWNEPSIQFYKNLGAMPMDDWTTFRLSGNALDELALVKIKNENLS